jgi:hypothetical protein
MKPHPTKGMIRIASGCACLRQGTFMLPSSDRQSNERNANRQCPVAAAKENTLHPASQDEGHRFRAPEKKESFS